MKNFAVVDFGSSKVVTLVGGAGVNDTLITMGKGEISYAGFQNAEFLEPESLKAVIGSSIANAEDNAQEKITEVYIGVPGEFSAVVSKNVTLKFPKVKKIMPYDIQSIFRTGNTFEKEPNYCLINQSVIYYELDADKRVINPLNFKVKQFTGSVSYCLAKRYFIDIIKGVFDDLNIKIKGFICEALAECLYLFDPALRDKYALLVDVGYITTTVALTRGNGLLYQNSFSMGGGHISSDLSQCLRIPFNEAERLKNKIALAWEPSTKDTYVVEFMGKTYTYAAKATNEIALDRVELICDYIQKSLDICNYDLPSFLPIYLAGGGLYTLKGVRNIMSQKLGRQVIKAVSRGLISISPYSVSEDGLLSFLLNNENDLDALLVKV